MILPSVSIVFFYSRIYFKVVSHHLNELSNEQPTTAHQNLEQRREIIKKTIKMTKGLFFACFLFLISHLPYAITVIVDSNDELPGKIYMYAATAWHLNSSLNCVLYAFTNSQLKMGYVNFLYLIFNKKLYSYTAVLKERN